MTPWTKLSKEERISEDIEMKLSEYGIADDCKVVVPATPVSDLDPVVFLLHEEFTDLVVAHALTDLLATCMIL